MNIQKLREKINKYDGQIIDLISKRQSLMPAVGLYKKQNKMPINQPQREKEMFIKIKALADEQKLSPTMLEKIFKTLIKDGKERQRKI
jgi:chorismate mutase